MQLHIKNIFWILAFLQLFSFFNCNKSENENGSINENFRITYSTLIENDKNINLLSETQLNQFISEIYLQESYDKRKKEDSLIMRKAIGYCDIIIEMNPKNRLAYSNKILFLEQLGNYELILGVITELMNETGIYPEALVYKGMVYEYLNYKDSAETYYAKGLVYLNKRIIMNNKLDDKIWKTHLYCLLNECDKALLEISILEEKYPTNEMIKLVKEDIKTFDREAIIKNSLNVNDYVIEDLFPR